MPLNGLKGISRMVSIEIKQGELIVRMHGWSKVLAMRGVLRIPLSRVRAVRARPKEAYFDNVIVDGWRGVGTYVPRKIAAGFVYTKDGPSFYDVRDPEQTIALDIVGEKVRRVVVQLGQETPDDAVRRIQKAISTE
jgi:hypothetical protein